MHNTELYSYPIFTWLNERHWKEGQKVEWIFEVIIDSKRNEFQILLWLKGEKKLN